MTAEATSRAPDVSNSLLVALLAPAAVVGASLICSGLRASDVTTNAALAFAGAVPTTVAVLAHRLRTSRRQRLTAVAMNDLGFNPVFVAVAVGSLLALAEGLVFRVYLLARALFVNPMTGVVASWPGALLANSASGTWLGLAVLSVVAVLVGRRAGHYITGQPWRVLVGAAGMFVVLGVSAEMARDGSAASGDTRRLVFLLAYYAIFATMAIPFLYLGTIWSRRTHDLFLGQRLLAQLSQEDRRAALELLREEVNGSNDEPGTKRVHD